MKQLNLYYLGGGGVNPDIPDGKTVTPINDVEIWQKCAGLDPVYNSLGEVLADSGYVAALMSDDNAVDYLVRSTDWATLPVSIVPTMTSDTAPSGQCFCVSVSSSYPPYRVFDRNDSTQAVMSNGNIAATDPSYIGYMFTEPVTVSKATIYQTSYTYNNCYIQYSDDGIEYNNASNLFTVGKTSQDVNFEPATGKYWRLYVGSLAESTASGRPIYSLQFYSGSVVTSQTAMQYIGASDYAADTLLNDTTWCEAICNSEYFTDVLTTTVPNMTSNVSPCGTVSASSIHSSDYDAYKAFDGGFENNKNEWCPLSSSGSTTWVQYDFGRALSIKKWGTYTRTGYTQYQTYTIYASNDNSNFVQVSSSYKASTGDAWNYFDCDLDDTTLYRYYRMQMTLSDTSKGNFKELQFYGRSNAGVQTWLHAANITDKSYTSLSQVLNDTDALITLMSTPNAVDYLVTAKTWIGIITNNETAMAYIGANDYAASTLLADTDWYNGIIYSTYANSVFNINVPNMTNNTLPEGECISNGAGTGAAWDNWYGFDGNWNYDTVNNSNLFMSNTTSTTTGWLGYKFTSPVEITLCQILLANNTTTAHNEPIMIQGSNDGSSWTNLLTGNISIAVPSRTAFIPSRLTPVSIPSPAKYQYYRITRNGTGVDRFAVVELQFLAHELGGVQTLLRIAGITDKNYTNIRQLLNDTETLANVLSSNDAVDYLATAKAWIHIITANETAMELIGLNNYVANTLLADTAWRKGIADSTYFESVLNVKIPAMTSATTPSGVVSASSQNSNNGWAYNAFDDNDSTLWGTSGSVASAWIQYEWDSPCIVYKYFILFNNVVQQDSFKISRSSDGVTFTDITETISTSVLSNEGIVTENIGQGTICRLTTNGNAGYGKFAKTIQFYGRKDV